MTPVLGGVAAVVAVVLAVWLLAGGARLFRRSYLRSRAQLRGAVRRGAAPASSSDPAERDWIYRDRPAAEGPRPSIAPTSDGPGDVADESVPVTAHAAEATAILQDAEAKAASILEQAQEKADEIVAAAEAAKVQLEQEVARDRALAVEERTKLTAFLSNVLDEVQRAGVPANVRSLSELRKLKRESELQ